MVYVRKNTSKIVFGAISLIKYEQPKDRQIFPKSEKEINHVSLYLFLPAGTIISSKLIQMCLRKVVEVRQREQKYLIYRITLKTYLSLIDDSYNIPRHPINRYHV